MKRILIRFKDKESLLFFMEKYYIYDILGGLLPTLHNKNVLFIEDKKIHIRRYFSLYQSLWMGRRKRTCILTTWLLLIDQDKEEASHCVY